MALNDAKDSMFSALLDPSPDTSQKNQKTVPRRRFRRCRSVPTDLILQKNDDGLLPRNDSFFNVHPTFMQVTLFLAVYLGVGTVCFYLVKDQIRGQKTNGILDAVYFCIVTMTTVGYGDLVPNSVPSKLLACAFVFTGMALVGLTLSKSADYLVEKQESLLVKCLHINKQVRPSDLLKEIEDNKVKYKFILNSTLLVLLMAIGTIFLTRVEHLSLVDAFYCVCSTITTLGYGDKSFSTDAGRIFAVFWILTSTICLGLFFLHLAELSTDRRQKSMVNWVLTRKMTHIDLEAADLDDDGEVSSSEFIIYKLREMGKINQEDIALVMREFEDLDVDQSGTLSASDIALAQTFLR